MKKMLIFSLLAIFISVNSLAGVYIKPKKDSVSVEASQQSGPSIIVNKTTNITDVSFTANFEWASTTPALVCVKGWKEGNTDPENPDFVFVDTNRLYQGSGEDSLRVSDSCESKTNYAILVCMMDTNMDAECSAFDYFKTLPANKKPEIISVGLIGDPEYTRFNVRVVLDAGQGANVSMIVFDKNGNNIPLSATRAFGIDTVYFYVGGLCVGCYYEFRIRAENSKDQNEFTATQWFEVKTKSAESPLINNLAVVDYDSLSIDFSFEIDPRGSQTDVWFVFGTDQSNLTDTQYLGKTSDSLIEDDFAYTISGESNTRYYYRVVVENSIDKVVSGVGNQQTDALPVPSILEFDTVGVYTVSADVFCKIDPNGLSARVVIYWGKTETSELLFDSLVLGDSIVDISMYKQTLTTVEGKDYTVIVRLWTAGGKDELSLAFKTDTFPKPPSAINHNGTDISGPSVSINFQIFGTNGKVRIWAMYGRKDALNVSSDTVLMTSDGIGTLPAFIMPETGQYYLKLFAQSEAGGEIIETGPFGFLIESLTGVSTKPVVQLSVYPNPTTDKFFIEGDIVDEVFTLLSSSGNVLSQEVAKDRKLEVKIENLSSGMYLYNIAGKSGQIIVQK